MSINTNHITADDKIQARQLVEKFIKTWEAAGYTDKDELIEPWAEQPVDENGDAIRLTMKELKALLY